MSSPAPASPDIRAAIDRKDWVEAEALLRQALAATPDDAGVLLNLGLALYRRGELFEAERFLNKAALRGAGAPSWLLLAELFAGQRRDAEALRAYKAVVKEHPAHFEALMALGTLRTRHGDRAGARENFRQAAAARPDDIEASLKYAESLWDEDPEAAVATTLAALPRAGNDSRARARVLQAALWQVEFIERIRRGQMPYHAAHLDELFFTHARAYLAEFEAAYAALAMDPRDAGAQIGLGLARFSRGDRSGAEALFGAQSGGILNAARFSPDFHEALRAMPDAELTEGLAPVVTLRPPVRDAGGVLYLSCDPVYAANFGLPLLCSLRKASPDTPVHLHLIDATPEDTKRFTAFCERLAPLRFALTAENPGLGDLPKQEARIYFHAVRLIRFYEALKLYTCPLWMTDVDALANAPLAGLFARLAGKDLALRIRPGRLEPQNQFSACAIGVAPNDRARAYMRQVAAYIAYFRRHGGMRWQIDQLALYSVFADLQDLGTAPALGLIGEMDVVLDRYQGGTLWMTAGAQKFGFIEREAQGAAPADTHYARAFAAYRSEAKAIASAFGWEI